ncbi:MAG: hypothetical protein NTV51_08755 [Verrucomicrobia bacterium]|nr:hypothetical protein [Verrucomicrobiota bacterium]
MGKEEIMSEVRAKSYEELERYLRSFTTWHGDEAVYDAGGAFHLWRALLDNLKEKGVEGEFADYAATLTPEEIRFLEQLLVAAKRARNESEAR